MKYTWLLALFFVGCSDKESFVFIQNLRPDEHGKIEWTSENKQVFLRSEIDNGGFLSEYSLYLSLNRIVDNDTLTYYLMDSNNEKYRVNNDKLYIYNNSYSDLYSKNFYVGWSKVEGQYIKSLNQSIGMLSRSDSLVIYSSDTSKLEIGLYKIKGKLLVRISNEPEDIFKQKKGIFFIPEPGCGVVRRYNLKDLCRVIMDIKVRTDQVPFNTKLDLN